MKVVKALLFLSSAEAIFQLTLEPIVNENIGHLLLDRAS
jgi:hypothetical protein